MQMAKPAGWGCGGSYERRPTPLRHGGAEYLKRGWVLLRGDEVTGWGNKSKDKDNSG